MKKFLLVVSFLLSANLYAEIYQEAVKELKMEEFAETYSKEKIESSLRGYKNQKEDLKERAAKAVLVDLGAVSVQELNNNDAAEKIKIFVSDYTDVSENYIGNVSDKNIIERLKYKWNNSEIIKDSSLTDILNKALIKGLITGYNIKDKKDFAGFNESLSASYGHNDITHASQIIALMKSENLDAKVQLEIKTSAFIYLPEWGESSYITTTMPDGTIIAHPMEYDLKMQFENQKDKERFFQLVKQYAKKDSEDEKGLLYESWWQPFIQSEKTEGFYMLIDNVVSDNKYEAHILTLPEKSKGLIDEISNEKNIKIETKEVWVNPSFYRFMLGEYK